MYAKGIGEIIRKAYGKKVDFNSHYYARKYLYPDKTSRRLATLCNAMIKQTNTHLCSMLASPGKHGRRRDSTPIPASNGDMNFSLRQQGVRTVTCSSHAEMLLVPAADTVPPALQAAALESHGLIALAHEAAGKVLGRIGDGARRRVNCAVVVDNSRGIGLTKEVRGASENAGKRALVLASSGLDGVGRDHGFRATGAAGPDAVIGEHGAVAARQALHADPLFHEAGAAGEGGVGHGVGNDAGDVGCGHGSAGEDVDDVGGADPG